MTTFQERLEALLQELPDTDALEESLLKKAANHKNTYPYDRDSDPRAPIDDTLRNVFEAMQNMLGYNESLSDYDDRAEHPLPPYYDELADALIHTGVVWAIMEEILWDGLLLLFVNHDGKRLTRWRDDLRRLDPPLSKCYDEAYALLFDLLNKSADLSGSGAEDMPELETVLTDEIGAQLDDINVRMEALLEKSYFKIAREYRDAIVPFL
jgi:hypothetical protein